MTEEIVTEKKRKKARTLEVREVGHTGDVALVEWRDADGRLRRCRLPQAEVVDGKVSIEALEMGVPYGLPLEEMIAFPTPAQVAEEFHRLGLWTLEDVETNPTLAKDALRGAGGTAYAALLEAARAYLDSDTEGARSPQIEEA